MYIRLHVLSSYTIKQNILLHCMCALFKLQKLRYTTEPLLFGPQIYRHLCLLGNLRGIINPRHAYAERVTVVVLCVCVCVYVCYAHAILAVRGI